MIFWGWCGEIFPILSLLWFTIITYKCLKMFLCFEEMYTFLFLYLLIDWLIDRLSEVLHTHLQIFTNNIILVRFTEILEPILGTLGMRLEYTLNARPVYCRAPCTQTLHTYSHLLDCFWKLEQNWRTLR